ncbi:DoxX family membrane protein [Streptomyces sodiiphilus]|uniref:DoxX family membrane protein n=1 Tax=Streptomyces sodiiphilus TaxID=226217 RepID=A0ABP5A8U4_9ACTN
MSVRHEPEAAHGPHPRARSAGENGAEPADAGAKALAALRIALGGIFLWAFLDKTFGLGYATRAETAWGNGGSPAGGYLAHVDGPMASTYHGWAGAVWVDWLYMAGMLGLGLALLAGVALRVTAASGTLMMAMMWLGQWPPGRELSDGSPSMSTNPLLDQHVVYALAMIALALCSAGRVWGLGRYWSRLPVVSTHRWLR